MDYEKIIMNYVICVKIKIYYASEKFQGYGILGKNSLEFFAFGKHKELRCLGRKFSQHVHG